VFGVGSCVKMMFAFNQRRDVDTLRLHQEKGVSEDTGGPRYTLRASDSIVTYKREFPTSRCHLVHGYCENGCIRVYA